MTDRLRRNTHAHCADLRYRRYARRPLAQRITLSRGNNGSTRSLTTRLPQSPLPSVPQQARCLLSACSPALCYLLVWLYPATGIAFPPQALPLARPHSPIDSMVAIACSLLLLYVLLNTASL